MDKRNYKTSLRARFGQYVFLILLFVFIVAVVIIGLGEAKSISDEEGLRIAEESIRRAVVSCFAAEGKYPPTFEYLEEHYGISIDRNKYFVEYEIIMENFMPYILVLRI
jgi:hypothetical protein